MCVINISLNPTTPAGTTITNRNGRYRKVGTTTWTNFTITSNTYALNVDVLGQYELQVNVTNSLGVVSAWASSTFSVTTDCGTIDLPPVTCNLNLVKVADNFRLENCTIGVTYQLKLNGVVIQTLQATGTTIIFQAPPGGFGTGTFIASNSTGCDSNSIVVAAVTNSGIFNNGTSVNHSHSLPSADPASSEIVGTLTVTGTKTYKVSIKNQFNYGNYGTGYLQIVRNGGTTVGTITAQTNGTSNTITSTGSITVTAGTYTYTLRATLDIIPTPTSGAVTATIV